MYLGDLKSNNDDNEEYEIEIADESKDYNLDLVNNYLLALLGKHLTRRESDVIRLSFGLDWTSTVP